MGHAVHVGPYRGATMPDVGHPSSLAPSGPIPVKGTRQLAAGIEEIAAGRPILLLGDPSQNGEADVVFAAALSTPELMAWCVRLTAGFRLRCPDRGPVRRPAAATPALVPVHARASVLRDRRRRGDRHRNLGPGQITHGARTGRSGCHAPTVHPPRPCRPAARRCGQPPCRRRGAVGRALAGLPAASVLSRLVSEENPNAMARGAEIHRFAARHSLQTMNVAEALGGLR